METSSVVMSTAQQGNGEGTSDAWLLAENARLKEQLNSSEQMVAELQAQLNRERKNMANDSANYDDQAAIIRKLENLVVEEKKQRLEAELELARLKDSLNSACEKCRYVVEGFRESLNVTEVQKNLLRLKEQFDELSKYMEVQLENDEEELMALATQIKERNQRLQNLIQRLNPHKLTQLIELPGNYTRNRETNEELKLPPTQSVEVEGKAVAAKRADGKDMDHAKKPRIAECSSSSDPVIKLEEGNESEVMSTSLENYSSTILTKRRSVRKKGTRSTTRSQSNIKDVRRHSEKNAKPGRN